VAELPEVLAEITEHRGHQRTCSCCGKVTRAEIPADIRAHCTGPKLAGAISFMSGCLHASKRAIEETCDTLFNVPLSLGTLSKLDVDTSAALEARKTGHAGLRAVKVIFKVWNEWKDKPTERSELQAQLIEPAMALCRALERGRDGPDKKVRRFCKRLLKDYGALWTFADVEGVEPTNNHAERCLRPAVMWRKRSFGNHSEEGCRFTERLLTAVQTLRLQKRPVLAYLESAIRNHRAGKPTPSLLAA